MIKKIWFKIFSLTIFAISILAVGLTFLSSQNNFAYAETQNVYIYKISNMTNSDSQKIQISKVFDNDSTVVLNDDLDCFDDVFNVIEQDLSTLSTNMKNSIINLNFDNFSIYNDWLLNLSYGNIILTGEISNPTNNNVIEIHATDENNFIFDNFILSSNSPTIINVKKSNVATNITCSNSSFESTFNHSYAFSFEDTICNLKLSNNNNHTTTYLMNYNTSITLDLNEFYQTQNKIYITLPIDIQDHLIINNTNININTFLEFCSENEVYEIKKVYFESTKNIYVSSYIKLNTDLNGGFYSNSIDSSFKFSEELILPKNLTNSTFYFGGWHGSILINNTTYYFDKQMLNTAKSVGFDKDSLQQIFKTDISNLSTENAFSKFFDSDEETTLTFLNLFTLYNQIPSIIAKWEYEIIYETFDGDKLLPQRFSINTLPNLQNATKEGHSFVGWFSDSSLNYSINLNNLKNQNSIIYAKFEINNYNITFKDNNNVIDSKTLTFSDLINFPLPTKTGYFLEGWKTNNDQKFLSTTMPASDLILTAIWQKRTYITFFESLGNEYINPIQSKFLDSLSQPTNPTRNGYSFAGWIDKETNLDFDFSTTPANDRTAVAQWTPKEYFATFNFADTAPQYIKFGDVITFIPTNPGYKFIGWYNNENEKVEVMPASDISLYPKWQIKSILSLSTNKQTKSIDDPKQGYVIDSNLQNFIIEYHVDNSWVSEIPTSVGTYDIRITRYEDDNYQAYQQIVLDGYQILPKYFDLDIVFLILFVCFFIEIVTIIIIRWLIKQKKSSPVVYSIIFPFAMFDTNEFIITIIAAVLFIAGFIWLIRELIILNNTVPTPTSENKYDNREIISKIEDTSNDIDIEQKVDDLLIKNKLIKPNEKRSKMKINTDENDERNYLEIFDDTKKQ